MHFGGVEVFNYNLIKSLINKNEIKYASLCNIGCEKAEYIRIKNNKYIGPYFSLLFAIITTIKNVDVYILSFTRSKWYNWIIFPILKKIYKKKYIVVIHGGRMSKWYFALPYKIFFKNADKVIGVSEIICKEYSKRAGIVVNFIPPLIPFKQSYISKKNLRVNYNVDIESFIFLYVGSLKDLKRPKMILNAIKNIGIEYIKKRKVLVFFAGNGPLYNEMNEFIKVNNLEHCVYLLGNVSRDKIDEYYSLTDAYIIASKYEGTPISLLEAMFNSLIIIGANSPGINSIISHGENGLIFDDELTLEKMMKYAIDNHYHLDCIKNNAFSAYNDKYTYLQVVEEYQKIFSSL